MIAVTSGCEVQTIETELGFPALSSNLADVIGQQTHITAHHGELPHGDKALLLSTPMKGETLGHAARVGEAGAAKGCNVDPACGLSL